MNTTHHSSPYPPRLLFSRWRRLVTILLAVVVLGGCGVASGTVIEAGDAVDPALAETVAFLDRSSVHPISVEFDQADYEAMIATYTETAEKEWMEATVTIDGVTYENVGIRLKGNSSLFGLGSDQREGAGSGGFGGSASADEPERLPWLIRLDKYVDGQSHNGIHDIVVRSNNTETSLNEAVALELLDLAGLAAQDAAYISFTVNGSDAALRLVVEHPDDVWLDDAFAGSGVLYKAESTGDYSYRGEDPEAYDEVFDLEAGEENGDLTPLIEFLDFINNADDEAFNSQLAERFDVEAFATYLAAQELINNFDDIDGRGNNSYLFYDVATETFTVVPWDHNLAFGGLGGDGVPAPGGPGFAPPEGFSPGERPERGPGALPEGIAGGEPPPLEGADDGGLPEGGFPPQFGDMQGGPGGGGPEAANILVDRFLAEDEWQAMYDEALTELRASLYESGAASDILDTWVELLTQKASDLVDAAVVTAEAGSVAAFFS